MRATTICVMLCIAMVMTLQSCEGKPIKSGIEGVLEAIASVKKGQGKSLSSVKSAASIKSQTATRSASSKTKSLSVKEESNVGNNEDIICPDGMSKVPVFGTPKSAATIKSASSSKSKSASSSKSKSASSSKSESGSKSRRGESSATTKSATTKSATTKSATTKSATTKSATTKSATKNQTVIVRYECRTPSDPCALVTCDDNSACTTDICNASSGTAVCVNTPITCDDNIACTADSCDAGLCVHTPIESFCSQYDIFNKVTMQCAKHVCGTNGAVKGGCAVESEITCINGRLIGSSINDTAKCECDCEPSGLFPRSDGQQFEITSSKFALTPWGVDQTPDCAYAITKSSHVHSPKSGASSAMMPTYSSLLSVLFNKDKQMGNGMNDYEISLAVKGVVRSNNNRGKCRNEKEESGLTGVFSTCKYENYMKAAAAEPALNFDLKTYYPEKFIPEDDDIRPSVYQEPEIIGFIGPVPIYSQGGYVKVPDERMIPARGLVDIDAMRNMKAVCEGCAIPVVDTEWKTGLNPDLWQKSGQIFNNNSGLFETYTNQQLINKFNLQDERFKPNGDFQFLEVMREDREVSWTSRPNLHLKKGSSFLPSALNDDSNAAFWKLEMEPIDTSKLQVDESIGFTTEALTRTKALRPASRFLFNSNDTDVIAMYNDYIQSRGEDAAGVCENGQVCSNACTEMFDSTRFVLLDGRVGDGTEWGQMYYPQGTLDPVDGVDKSQFQFFIIAKFIGKSAVTSTPSYMEKCVSSKCCDLAS